MVKVKLEWVAAVLVVVTALVWHYVDKRNAIQRVHAEYTLKAYKNAEQTNKTTIELLNSSLVDLQKKDNEIKRITILHDNLAERLRNRPSRNSSTTSEARKTCTGAELYREDGLFLAGEAARAERIIKERDFYYEQYERARQRIESLGSSSGENAR